MTKICSIPDCGKPARSRGWCKMHHNRWLRHGDPLIVKKAGIRVDPIPWLDEPDEERRSFAADDPRHGTLKGYAHMRCRCDECRVANYVYQQRRRDERRVAPK
jgi:hypothetical protein